MRKLEQSKHVLGRRLARPLDEREIALASGANFMYDKNLVGCETCITCYGYIRDIQPEFE